MNDEYAFPKDFVWGTAISAYQTEGNNTNTDWWEWEHSGMATQEPSDGACDFYNRYNQDFNLCKELGNNAVRLSVEWARIEPKEGEFDQKEVNHYKEVLKNAHDHGLKTFVTLHHFSNPLWLAKKGGWINLKAPFYFSRYAEKCAQEFGNLIDFYITINEPQVYALQTYVKGVWPPQKKNYFLSLICQINFMRANNLGYKKIKKHTNSPVGLVKNIVWYDPSRKYNPLDILSSKILYFLNSTFFLVPIMGKLDFIGLNYYFTNRMRLNKWANLDDVVSDLNWWIYPEGLKRVLLDLKKYNKPIYITENGLADASDRLRKTFIREMLEKCWESMQSGANVKGYFHWSLIDNYEWHRGFWPRFGLVEIDYKNNMERKPRPSFYYYAQICKNGKLS